MEHTISDLQAQVDRLNLALSKWQDTQGDLRPLEERLSQLTERGEEILNHWADTDHRHVRALGEVEARLSEWGQIEQRLRQESLDRIRQFEQTVEAEWKTLRELHEEPLKHLREQATALSETCMAAANLSLRGYERAESRLAALEADLRGQLAQLTNDVQAALAEARADRAPALAPQAAPFPLDSVMRIHDELREPAKTSAVAELSVPDGPMSKEPATREDPWQLPDGAATILNDRVESLARQLTQGTRHVRETAARADRLHRDWRLGFGVLVVGLVVVGGLGWQLQQRVNARLDDASSKAAAASAAANQAIVSARAESERQTAAAAQAAVRAQLVSDVLASPDVLRFGLTGTGPAQGASAQILWSRSRGLVLSASRVPPVSAGQHYQVWLLSNAGSVRMAGFVPDASGRATAAVENPAEVPRPVHNVTITVEPDDSTAAEPTGPPVLARSVQ